MAHSHHGHGHDHGHHHHAPKDFGRAFAIGVALNSLFVVAEAGIGIVTGSLALIADAGHNLSDVLSLLLAWGATVLAKRAPTARRTYGFRKATVLASLANAMLLFIAVGVIVSEAVRRFGAPTELPTTTMAVVAGLGVIINFATAMMFAGGHDLNARGAFLHMAADAAVSAGVVAGALAIAWTGQLWIDPALSLVIVAVILAGSVGLLRDSANLALDAVPEGIDPAAVRDWLTKLPGVTEVHDLHIWALSTTENALTAHLTRPDNADPDAFLHGACEALARDFGIGHATLQVETGQAGACRLSPAEAV